MRNLSPGFDCAHAGMGFGMMTVESILDSAALGSDEKRAQWRRDISREPSARRPPYEQWMQGEGVPVHGATSADVRAAEVNRGKARRARAYRLEGGEATDGAYLVEIGGGPARIAALHVEEVDLRVDGRRTTVWHENRPKPNFNGRRERCFTP